MIEDLSMTISQTPLHKALFYPHFIDQETRGSALIFEVPYCSVSQLCLTPWIVACQAFLSFTISLSLLKLMSIQSMMPSNHLILCWPLLLLPSVFPSIRVSSSELVLRIRWPKYWSLSFSISPSNEHSGLISSRTDWVGSPCCPRDFQESSLAPQFESINASIWWYLFLFSI